MSDVPADANQRLRAFSSFACSKPPNIVVTMTAAR
jgi:hypothetical protein